MRVDGESQMIAIKPANLIDVAVEAMLDHMPNLRYAARHEAAYEDSFILRGLKTLDLDFDPTA